MEKSSAKLCLEKLFRGVAGFFLFCFVPSFVFLLFTLYRKTVLGFGDVPGILSPGQELKNHLLKLCN